MKKLKFALYILIYFLGFALLGLLNLAVLNWDWSVVTFQWIIELNLYNVLYYAFFLTTLMFVFDAKETDERLVKDVRSLEALRPQVEGQKLRTHVDELNWYEKVEKHKEITIKRRSRLIKRKLTNKVSMVITYGIQNKKGLKRIFYWFTVMKTKRFVKKRNHYDLMLTDAWIDKNLLFVKTIYPVTEYSELLYGTTKVKMKRTRFVRSYVRREALVKMPLLLLSTMGTVLLTVVQIMQFNDIRNLILDLAIILTTLCANVITGIFAAFASHKRRCVDTSERLELLLGFRDGTNTRIRKLPTITYETENQKELTLHPISP